MNIKHLLIGAGGIALTALHAPSVLALGDAGQTISNRATVNYQVGTVDQSPVESSPTGNSTAGAAGTDTSFVEDRLLNFSIVRSDLAAVAVTPGQDGDASNPSTPVLTFTITNNGNGCQDFRLAATQVVAGVDTVFGETDDFNVVDPTGFTVLVESAVDVAQTFAGDETETFINELCPGEVATAYIVLTGTAAIPLAQVNGDHALFTLAAFVNPGTTGPGALVPKDLTGGLGGDITSDDSGNLDTTGVEIGETVQVVFALDVDGSIPVANLIGSNAAGSVQTSNAYIVSAAELITSKVSIVSAASPAQFALATTGIGNDLSATGDIALGALDNVGVVTHGLAKRITGAVVSYAIEVQNDDTNIGAGIDAATANEVFISDGFSLIMGATLPFVDATPTATLITDNGGTETTTAIVTPVLDAAFDQTDPYATHATGDIVYVTDTNEIFGLCGNLRGNDGAIIATALDEACRLVVDLTVQ